jgi:tetratricopeptide (TPR) repeat protein
MFRVTSLTEMPEAQLNRLIRRFALLFLVVLVAFVAFYAVARFRFSPAPIADQQLAAAEDLVRADPADVIARGQLADLYYVKGRFEEAVTQYSLLIDAGKEVELASLGRGKAYYELKQYDKALPDFQKVVEIANTGEMASVDPMLASGYYGIGQTYIATGRPADAVDPLRKALAIEKTDADVLYALGIALLDSGQAQEAVARLTTATQMVPSGWPEPYRALQRAYTQEGDAAHADWAGAMAAFASGDAASAKAQLEKLTSGDLALEASIGLGVIYESEGETGQAADWYRKALAINPNDVSATLGLGRVSMPAASPAEGNQ